MPEVAKQKKSRGLTTVAFSDVVQLSKERSSDPAADGYDRYIGLEHIDPGELLVRRWGNIANGVTFTNVFHPGQVLFGKRRAYQRKVAVADFSGVCSGDIYVLEPKGNALLPELLPFICQTDAFFEHAVGTSAGSLSPRTNWKSLANFEFTLPTIEEQRRIVQLLTASRRTLDALYVLRKSADLAANAYLATTADRLAGQYRKVSLGEVADVRYGLTVNQQRRGSQETRPYLRVANVARGSLDLAEVKEIGCLPGDGDYELRPGDILIVEGHASVDEIGRAAMWRDEIPGTMHQNHLIRSRCQPDLHPEFLLALINSSHGRTYFRSCAKSSSGLNTINSAVVKQYPIPIPPVSLQDNIVAELRIFDSVTQSLQERALLARSWMAEVLRLCSEGEA
jgi:type I restriction enzyme S subunit